jgi:TonB-linked SusC/RagA family outer membrane protein
MIKNLPLVKFVWVALLVLLRFTGSLAQSSVISGTVTDETGSGIPGVTVVVVGTTSGTTTNESGQFTLSVPAGAALVVTSVGFKRTEVVVGDQSVVNIRMVADAELLNEVVVTALGQTQEKRAIGYSIQTLKAEEITASGNPNVLGALQGKIAGAIITGSGGAPGAGINIILRGITSLSGGANNQPLFVVDGIIISNSTTGGNALPSAGSNSPGAAEQFSNTNRGADINPDDIETISVLKGPAATALYGLRASNGAVIITTKRGKSGKMNVSLSSSVGVDVVGKTPSIQTKFLQGRFGEFVPITDGGRTPYQSFGPLLDEQNTTDRIYDNLRDFYRTGFRTSTNLAVSKGVEKGNVYFSLGRNKQTGIVPNTDFDRTSVKVAGGYNLTRKFTASGSFYYINSGGNRPPSGDKSLFSALGYWPNTYDVNDYLNEDGTYKNLLPGFTDNPRYLAEKSPRIDKVNRYIADVTLNYELANWLSAKYQMTLDAFRENRSRQVDPVFDVGTAVRGFLIKEYIRFREVNSNLYLTAKKDFGPAWRGSVLVGNSVVDSDYLYPDSYYIRGEGWQDPFDNTIDSYTNQQTRYTSPNHYRIVSFFADARLEYRDLLYFNLTARNDQVSTLPRSNNSFFYPSFSVGYVFTEHFEKTNWLSYGKLRASWAQVGKGADPYVVGIYYDIMDNFPFNEVVLGYFRRVTTADPNLRPERTTSIELGAELHFLRNRLSLDATYFTMDSKDQIVRAPVSNGSGFSHYYTNIGLIRNSGVELMLTAKPVQTKTFTWEMTVNWSKMAGKVIEMPDALDQISYYDNTVGSLRVREGSKLGELWGYDYDRAPDGQLLIQSDGFPRARNTGAGVQPVPYGNALPDWVGGWTNTISWKGLSLSALMEWRHGGDVIDLGDRNSLRSGLLALTERRYEQVVFKGVVAQTATDGSVTYVPNTKQVYLDDTFYNPSASTKFVNWAGANIQDAPWIRLRTLNVGYALPRSVIGRSIFKQGVRFSFTATNLFLNTPFRGYDPESLSFGSGTNIIGFVGRTTPATKSFQLGVTLNF